MEIKIANSAGFCFGVEKAVNTAFSLASREGSNIYTLGPIIHNKSVINELNGKGIKAVTSIDEIKEEDATVIIRAHGVPRSVYEELSRRNFNVVDATCPFVKKIHRIVEKYSREGYKIIITGDKNHPEVIGTKGWCENDAYVIDNVEDLKNINREEGIFCLVSQTTFNKEKWNEILNLYKLLFDKSLYFDTICSATSIRQLEAAEIASEVDLMIVIGDRNSSNTMKLFEICSKSCNRTVLIETPGQLAGMDFSNINKIGITAGASTPDEVIREVTKIMSEVNTNDNNIFATLLEESLTTLSGGEIVKGPIVRIDNTGAYVDLGFKYEGFIPIEEFQEDPVVGEEVEAIVIRVNDKDGEVLLSKKRIDSKKSLKNIEESFNNQTPINVKITNVVKGGLVASAGGIRVFIPASQVSDKYISDLESFLKKNIDVIIIDYKKGKKGQSKIVGSHRLVLTKAKEKAEGELWSNIEKGKVYKGVVKSLTSFGAFVDIGGVDGLVHLSELSWSKIKHPSEVVNVGDEIEVTVLDFDKENKKISLGYKKEEDNPWLKVEERYKLGDVVKCKVVRFVPFGVFVELENGIDGLVHISQISNVRLNRASEVLNIGQEVEAKIVEMDPAKKKINLSIKEVEPIDPVKKDRTGQDAEMAKQPGEASPESEQQ